LPVSAARGNFSGKDRRGAPAKLRHLLSRDRADRALLRRNMTAGDFVEIYLKACAEHADIASCASQVLGFPEGTGFMAKVAP
jgi:hypothetical protein